MLLAPLLLGALALPSAARAEPPPPTRAEPSDAEVSRRLAFLQDRFDRAAPAAARWWYGWYGGWLGLTVIQSGIALGIHDRGLRTSAAVSAAFTTLGVIPLGLVPFQPLLAPAALRAQPEGTPAERRAKLARGERLLEESATIETRGHSFLPHLLGGVVSLGSGLVLVLAYKRPLFSGIVNLVGGVALCELEIYSQPSAAISDWKDYQAHGGEGPTRAASRTKKPSFMLSPSLGGMGISGSF
jgi:hypothetical protein